MKGEIVQATRTRIVARNIELSKEYTKEQVTTLLPYLLLPPHSFL